MVLRERYASLICVVAITVAFMPLLPYLAPMACLGLFLRYWSEKYIFLRSLVIVRSGTPIRTALRATSSVLLCLWLSAVAGCLLSVWVLWRPPGEQLQVSFADGLSGPALPVFVLLCTLMFAPLLSMFAFAAWHLSGCRGCSKKCHGRGRPKQARLNFQEAWLVMRHRDIVASYRIHEHPTFQGGSVLKSLQPDLRSSGHVPGSGGSLAGNLGRNIDITCSMAVVGDRPPTRK